MFLNIEQFYASVFDCERAATATALEEVCRTLQVDGDQRASEVMAVRIVGLARRGERDPQRLSDRVLREAGTTRFRRAHN
jgi:hypothetical protein